jgi:DNA-binding response OmpR family regulator
VVGRTRHKFINCSSLRNIPAKLFAHDGCNMHIQRSADASGTSAPHRRPAQTSISDTEVGAPTIFVVEDDADIAGLVCLHLNSSGYSTKWMANSATVIEEAERDRPALLLLDIMIPGSDGIELCRHIRANKTLSQTRIIFLTAKTGEADRIKGFEFGGDDYITKPFSPRELVARVRAVLRRNVQTDQSEILELGAIAIDVSSMILKVNGQIVPTTAREFRLLHYLACHRARVFTRDQLLDAVWSAGCFVTPRSVDVYMRRLREKIEPDPEKPSYLKTVRGIGYRFDVPQKF